MVTKHRLVDSLNRRGPSPGTCCLLHVAVRVGATLCRHAAMPPRQAPLWPRLHVALAASVPNGRYVEYIPQLETITKSSMTIKEGKAVPSDEPGLGIEWDIKTIQKIALAKTEHK